MESKLCSPQCLLFLLVLLFAFLALACQLSVTAPGSESTDSAEVISSMKTPPNETDKELVLNSFLQETDLPAGWFQDYYGVDLVEGDTVYAVSFRKTDDPDLDYIFVAQEIILYDSELQAEYAFGEKWKESEPSLVIGQPPAEIDFKSKADEFSIGCLYSTTALQPENFCSSVARYDRLISILYTKTWDEDDEEQWFTWADFERTLEAMDRRALDAQGK
jgi:hypothetical protein